MAMTKCKECNNLISDQAATCPACGVSLRVKQSFGVRVLCWSLKCAFWLGLIIFICWLAGTGAPQPGEDRAARTMNVGVSVGHTFIEIQNDAVPGLAGQLATLYLNATPPNGWKASCILPVPGSPTRMPLSDFITRDGERFNPYARAVTEVWIGGNGYDFKCMTLTY